MTPPKILKFPGVVGAGLTGDDHQSVGVQIKLNR